PSSNSLSSRFLAAPRQGTSPTPNLIPSRGEPMKKLINAVPDVVKEQLEGMAAAHPDQLKVHFEPNFVCRADAPVAGKVAIISGGGSGHEPMHGGFVGMGMLDAACPGEVFTSPT